MYVEIVISNVFNLNKKKLFFFFFLIPPQRRGSHVKSDNTNTIINMYPYAHILVTYALIFISCTLLTVYPNRIM